MGTIERILLLHELAREIERDLVPPNEVVDVGLYRRERPTDPLPADARLIGVGQVPAQGRGTHARLHQNWR